MKLHSSTYTDQPALKFSNLFVNICIVSQSTFLRFFLFLILDKKAKYNHINTHITKYKHLSLDVEEVGRKGINEIIGVYSAKSLQMTLNL